MPLGPFTWSRTPASANGKNQLDHRAQFGRERFVSEKTSNPMPLFKKPSRFGSFLNGMSSSDVQQSNHKASRTLFSWSTGRITALVVSCIVLFMACRSSDFVFELSPTRPLPFTFRFFTTRFGFIGSRVPTTLTWGPYHIEYHTGAYPIPNYGQEYGSLSVGGKIIKGLTSATYSPPSHIWKSIFSQGARVTRSPELTLMDGMDPGQCWPLRGASGQLGIQLPQAIRVLALTVGHGKTSSTTSAPKNLTLWGLKPIDSDFCSTLGDVGTPKPKLGSGYCGARLLSGMYEPSTLYQNFTGTNFSYGTHYFDRIIIQILGNWGHPKATCIYRIQIYGEAL